MCLALSPSSLLGEASVGLSVGEDDADKRQLWLVELEPAARPEVREAGVEAFEECAAPLGIGAGRVVADDVVRGGIDLEAIGKSGEDLLADFVGRERHKGLCVGLMFDKLGGLDCPELAVACEDQ